jgi:hypothetical protein
MKVFEFSKQTNFAIKEIIPTDTPQPKFKIGQKIQHINGKWLATVKAVKFDYAYGLGQRTTKKLYLYTLTDKYGIGEIMGLWGEPELLEA